MPIRFFILVCLTLQCVTAHSGEVNVLAHTNLSDHREKVAEQSYLVPKQVLFLDIESLSSTWFTAAPVYPEWSVPGIDIRKSDSQGLSIIKKVDGISYAGLKHRFLLVPLTTGKLAGNQEKITLSPGLSSNKHQATLTLPNINVRLPDGAESLEQFLPASQLTLNDDLSFNAGDELHAGDSFTRTISVNAAGIMGFMIPAINAGEIPDGISVYPEQTTVGNTVTDRNDFLGGYRQQTLTYQLNQVGDYQLPEMSVRWWNLSTQQFETTHLPAVAINVLQAKEAGAESQLQLSPKARIRLVIRQHQFLMASFLIMLLILIQLRAFIFKTLSVLANHFQSLFFKIKKRNQMKHGSDFHLPELNP
ncbi:hypothetical protein ACH42_06235 [Endozoicomonas sp. (ex Bugula neritina AB1)]|nr:hypothetical protein ACH42_06235 [Endozoicomonas sp. (ex Bugula neritina AB1)]